MTMSDIIASCSVDIFDFHGGIHPEEHKTDSNQRAIRTLGLPPKLILPLKQHVGAASKLQVNVGQKVLKGQKLADADGPFSVALHAPTSGEIIAIDDQFIAHPSGQTDACITLIPDGKDQWCELYPCEDYRQLSASEIQAKVIEAGVAGMGGAGFPTAIKIAPPNLSNIDTLILNAAECEPYITSDDRLLQERAHDVVAGLEILIHILGVHQCLIGIEDNKPEAIQALKKSIAGKNIQLCVIPTKYPSGGEKQIIKLLTNKEVPNGGIPADIGIVCHNVATVAAIYRAVRFGEPLISRITTLTGQQIQERGNVEVLLGTPIDWMLEQVNYQPAKVERLIMGGPMMGFTLRHYHVPVVKTTNCILAPSLKELPLAPPAQACIRCGLCAEVCPAELLPQQLYWFSRAEEYEKAEHHNLFDCIECGACSYVCPSSIPLVQYYRYAKGEIKQQRENKRKSDHARERFEARQQRLEQEQLEKAAKRKERAEAAAKAQAAKLAQAKKEPAISSAEISKAEAQETQGQTPVTQAPVVEKIDLAELKLTWEKAQAKLDKMYDALDDAKANNPEQVDKLKRAVEKNQMRTNQAKSAWQKAEKAQKNQESTFSQTQNNSAIQETEKPDLEVLALTLEKAESKLAKMEDALAQAAEDQKEKLTRAVDKNKVRVEQAKQALQDAKAALAHSNQVNIVSVETVKPDIDALTLALEKAESKLTKMEDALAQAADDQREKLTRAVDKNKARVDAAKHALAEAKQQVNLESIDQADGGKS
jgi:electron transport complex protein RnfC